jgi:regulatory protein
MKISSIKAQIKNPNRVSVFVDDRYSFSLTLDQLLDEKLKKGSDIDQAKVSLYKKLSSEGKQKQRSLEWLAGRPHSIKEYKDYLYKKNIEPELIDDWTNEFTKKGYLNDEKFAKWYADNRKRKSRSNRVISADLRAKGVQPVTIQNILTEYENNISQENLNEKETLEKLVNKLRDRPRYQDRQKFIAYLLSKGFNYQDIKDVLYDF